MNQRFFAAVLCGCFLLPAGPAWSAPTAEQKKELEEVTALMAKAGGLFKAKNFSDCGDVIKTAQGKIEKLASGGDLTVHNQLKPLHEKLTKAYQLLELEGIELPELKPLGDPVKLVKPEKPDPKKDMPPPAASSVSFVKHIVPLVMAKCGNCHVNQTKGGFAMPTYEALMIGNKDGKVIFPGDASGSRFI